MSTPSHLPQVKYLPQETISAPESPNLPPTHYKGSSGDTNGIRQILTDVDDVPTQMLWASEQVTLHSRPKGYNQPPSRLNMEYQYMNYSCARVEPRDREGTARAALSQQWFHGRPSQLCCHPHVDPLGSQFCSSHPALDLCDGHNTFSALPKVWVSKGDTRDGASIRYICQQLPIWAILPPVGSDMKKCTMH